MDVEMEDTEDHGMSGDHETSSAAGSSGHQTPPQQQALRIPRRGSMSADEEKERRASIKAILADKSISPQSRRKSIQHLMDGRRGSMGGSSHGGSVTSGGSSVASGGSSVGDDASYHSGAGGPPMTIHTTPQGYEGEDCFEASEQIRRMEQSRPPCTHYERNCTMIAPCCGAAFGCRICHDDCPILPPKIEMRQRMHRSASLPSSFTNMEQQVPQDTHHNIDRFAVKEIICRECFTRQSSGTNNCIKCNIQFGEYHCNICNLWMTNDERPYHCPDCGFCRVGGAENFQHCHDCGMCIDRSLYTNHNCKSGKYKSNCPVCQEFLFSSRSASHEMPCGHAIHWECFRQLAAHDSRCPVCKKTAETRERMMPTWNAMAAGVALQPVPPELCRVVNITCNDCEQQDDARAWHFLGVQCRNCSSFNTVVDRIIMSGEEAYDFLETMTARRTVLEGQQRAQDGQEQDPSEAERAPRAETHRRRPNRRRSHF